MIYVMIDTNIFIDMIIDRRHNVSGALVESFIKLLDFDEIKLVIPAIVVYEANKHIEEQLAEVGKKIKSAIKSIEDIYGINGYTIDGLEISEYKKNSKKELSALDSEFQNNKSDYLKEIKLIIKRIFEHRNCLVIEDTEALRSACVKRRIYKRAPFHHEKKESYADGLIVETLLHLKDKIIFETDDRIMFVTGNTSDFSDMNNREELHKDILDDLSKENLHDKICYITTFGRFIRVELNKEVENANLKEEFEKEMQAQEESEREQYYADIEDLEREAAGLSSLSSFENNFEESFSESLFVGELITLFERINCCYSELEDATSFYSDVLIPYIDNIPVEEVSDFIKGWNKFLNDIGENVTSEDISGLKEVLEWIELKIRKNDYSELISSLPDYINYGDNIVFYCSKKEKYELTMDKMNLSCLNGDVDWLDIYLYYEGKKCESGRIEITYGFMEYTDDGGIADACGEEISYQTDELIEGMESIVSMFEDDIEKEVDNIEKLKEIFGL